MEKNSESEDAVLNLIKSNPLGYHQNALWKELNIDSRKCSRIVKKLLDSGLITRENAVIAGSRTYLLKAVGVEKKNNYELLIAGDEFSPCTGCTGNCVPEECPALTIWIMNLSENPEEMLNSGCFGYTKLPDILPEADYGSEDDYAGPAGPGSYYDDDKDRNPDDINNDDEYNFGDRNGYPQDDRHSKKGRYSKDDLYSEGNSYSENDQYADDYYPENDQY